MRGKASAAAPATRFHSAREKVPAVRMISSRISRLRLESSSMLMYSSVSSMYSPALSIRLDTVQKGSTWGMLLDIPLLGRRYAYQS